MILENEANIDQLLQSITHNTQAFLSDQSIDQYGLIGIHSGGVWIAEELHRRLNCQLPLGTLDISFYRDDFSRQGLNPTVKPSELPFDIEGSHIILVDDVIMSGRTIRAAMNELFDYGRPKSVSLITLIELKGRELPIQPNITGKRYDLPSNKRVKLRGPSPLYIVLKALEATS